VESIFVSVSDAGEGRPIVRRSVVVWEDAEFTGKRRDVIGKPRKGRRHIGRPKTVVGTGGARRMKKRWMIPLQEGWQGVL